jgi:hypothetical protein
MPLTNPGVVQISASDATYTGTVRITGGPNVTVGTDASGVTISGADPSGPGGAGVNIAASNTTYTSGTITITGVGGGVTVSSNTGQRVDISVAAPAAAQTAISGVAGSNTTYTSGTVELTGSNMITVKSSANQRLVIDATQTVQTQNMVALAASNTTYTSGDGHDHGRGWCDHGFVEYGATHRPVGSADVFALRLDQHHHQYGWLDDPALGAASIANPL